MKKTWKFLSVFLSLVLLVCLAAPLSSAATLTDISGNWAKSYIEQGVKEGWLSGYPDGTFRPGNTVTRGAFCKMLNKALGLEAAAAISFTDVKSTDTFYSEIRKAVYAGYISGYNDKTFRASRTITRQEAAVMLSRVLTAPAKLQSLTILKDSASIASYAKAGVQTLISKGYLPAEASGKFNPAGPMTRAQTAAAIGRMLAGEKVVRKSVSFTTGGKTYSSNLYVGPLSVSVPKGQTLTFSNCKILGKLTISTACRVNLVGSGVVSMTCNASSGAGPTVVASGKAWVTNTYLSGGASLTESSLTGSGFASVSLNGTALESNAANLTGAFTNVTVSSPANLNLHSGSIANLTVTAAAAGSKFALASGTKVAAATLNGGCEFTGKGTITACTQNVTGVSYETAPGKVTGSAANAAKTFTATAVTPANGAAGVAVTATVRLTFAAALLNADGGVLTPEDVANDAIELRSGSATGAAVAYTAAIGTDWKSITVTPAAALTPATTYYVILPAGGLKNSTGGTDARTVYTFTTAAAAVTALTATVSPANGAVGVAVTAQPTLTFSEAVYAAYDGSTLTSAAGILPDAVGLYQGSPSAGVPVAMTPSISGQVITLTPAKPLSASTFYTIVLNGGYLRNAAGTVNAAQTYTFTTSAAAYVSTLTPTVSPASGATGVSVTVHPTLTFQEDIYAAAYAGTQSAGYVLTSAVALYEGSVSSSNRISMTPSISGRVITLVPTAPLDAGAAYIIVLNAGYLKNAAGDTNIAQTYTFTTSAGSAALTPIVNPAKGAAGVSISVQPTLTFQEDIYAAAYTGMQSAGYVLSAAFQLYQGGATGGTPVAALPAISGRVVTLAPVYALQPNTTYTIVLNAGYLKNAAGTTNAAQTFSFTTGAA
jgi:hypothetical protein